LFIGVRTGDVSSLIEKNGLGRGCAEAVMVEAVLGDRHDAATIGAVEDSSY
jgi:hypothetical protein